MEAAQTKEVPTTGVLKSQLFWIIPTALIVVVLDQVTKAIVIATINLNPVFREATFFQFTHQTNSGLVGGILSGRDTLTLVLPILATLFLAVLWRSLDAVSRLQSVTFAMVLGGAVGNLIDRIRLGFVTDFLQFHFYFIPFDFPWKRYPAFNIADSAICVGVVVLVLIWNTGPKADPDASSTL